MNIEWMEPPPRKRLPNEQDWAAVAAELRENPGRWARVQKGATHRGLSTNITSGIITSFRPKGSFETSTRNNADGFDIFVRYIGDAP